VNQNTGEIKYEDQLTEKEKKSGDWKIIGSGGNRKQRRADAARKKKQKVRA
jgi:hypothetical protein